MREVNYEEMMKCYPILFQMRNRSMRETCMCWGIQCGPGWFEAINELCMDLEEMNNRFSKYDVSIVAEEVKEKFGTLRFYYTTRTRPPFFKRVISSPFKFIENLIRKHVNFKYDHVVDEPGGKREEWCEIDKKTYDKKEQPKYVSNDFGWKFKEENGKYYRNSCVYYSEKSHRVLKNHKILNWLMLKMWDISDFLTNFKTTEKQHMIEEYMMTKTDYLVRKAEDKCFELCEDCGNQITDESFNPRCQTVGYITYLCETCASKDDNVYIKNGKTYKNKKPYKREKKKTDDNVENKKDQE